MWNTLKSKATESFEVLRPSFSSLSSLPVLSKLIPSPDQKAEIKETMVNSPPNKKKTLKELKEEEEQKKLSKGLQFLIDNGEFMNDVLRPMINDSIERRKNDPKNPLKTQNDAEVENDRIGLILIKIASETESTDELLWAIEDEIEKVENAGEKKQLSIKNVTKKLVRTLKRIVRVVLFPSIALVIASLIANEMIIYPAPIRLVFFLFTFIICATLPFVLFSISFFFLCKWGYDYYVNEMSDGPKRIIMPTLFAVLPLTTKTYNNRFINWLAKPFQYGETWSKADGEELNKRMELYDTALKEAFPYVEAIKTQDPFEQQLQKIVKAFSELHQPPLPPVSAPVSALPATVQANNPENVARFSAIPSGPLPAVISPAPEAQ
jgi:hypothetical protein